MAGENDKVAGVAGRYATALFELAKEENALAAVADELKRIEAMLDAAPDLARLVRSPVFSAAEQSRALDAVLEWAGIGGMTANFFRLITANRRLFAVRDMMKGFRGLLAEHRGEVTAEVASAHALSEAHVTALKATLKEAVGRDVAIKLSVDPTLLGGLVVKVGSRMIDSSIRTKLNALKFAMKEVR